MKRTANIIVATLCMAHLAGCSTVSALDHKTGTQVSQKQLDALVKGKTSRADVIALIGQPPMKSERMGKEIWTYPYSRIGALPFSSNTSESTVVEFDKNGLLLNAYKAGGTPGQTGNALLDAAGH